MFFASYCGLSSSRSNSELVRASIDEEKDLRCLSVREAVNFAKSTNLLGVILEATTLVGFGCSSRRHGGADDKAAVPSLVASVKDAGLLLASFGDSVHLNALRAGASDGRTIDAFVVDGWVGFSSVFVIEANEFRIMTLTI